MQDVKPNKLQMARIKKLPIYVTNKKLSFDANEQLIRPSGIYHITEKKAPREVRQRAYSTFKAYPQLISEIETKKPRAIVFTSAPERKSNVGYTKWTTYGSADEERGIQKGTGIAVVRAVSQPRKKYDIEAKVETAKTTRHELEHIRQQQISEKRPSLQKKYSAGRYNLRLEERQAYVAEQKLEKSNKEFSIKRVERSREKGELSKEDEELYDKRIKKYKEKQEQGKESGFKRLFRKVIRKTGDDE
jgi:hypothetical protein